MTEQPPQVSVVIPTRDRRRLLESFALPSARAQRHVRIEVLVVDDGSSDGTAEAVTALGDPRIRLVRNDSPRGVSASRNAGVAAAAGNWVAFLDDDDLWAPTKLQRQLAAASATGAPWGYAASIVVDESLTPIYEHPVPAAIDIADALQGGNVVPAGPSNVIARVSLLREIGPFDESLAQGEDWDVWLRLAERAVPAVVPEVLVATLQHGDRSIFRYSPDALEDVVRMLAKHRPLTRRDRLGATEWLASQQVLAGRWRSAAALYLAAAVRYHSAGNLVTGFGALFGERGLNAASALLLRTRGVSHVEPARAEKVTEPEWLAAYRTR
jgi:glycosyltransferase involved in cell wall biosynthesis